MLFCYCLLSNSPLEALYKFQDCEMNDFFWLFDFIKKDERMIFVGITNFFFYFEP